MTERKMRRLVTAGTVVAVVVLFLMIVVLIVQMCALSARKKQLRYQKEKLIAAEKDLEDERMRHFYESSDEAKLIWALKYGYTYPDENE
ncbi:MAG: hypothetical protein SPJ70_03255 [Candidatus Borkfalkiaceae bacterium]|nr:hypothetical protein [Christensenellaceae bacterium]